MMEQNPFLNSRRCARFVGLLRTHLGLHLRRGNIGQAVVFKLERNYRVGLAIQGRCNYQLEEVGRSQHQGIHSIAEFHSFLYLLNLH